MRIAFFDFIIHSGGTARCTVDMAGRLKPLADVHVVDAYGCCPEYVSALESAGVPLHVLDPRVDPICIGGKGSFFHRGYRAAATMPHLVRIRTLAARKVLDLAPDIIICNNFKSCSILGFSRAIRHVPLVAYCHGWYTPDMVPAYARWLSRHRCDGLVAVSQATKAALVCSGIDPARIFVLHNSIDVDAFLAQGERPPAGPLPQGDRPVRLLMPASLIKTKGQGTAIRAMRRIVDAGHDAVLWLAGTIITTTAEQRRFVEESRRSAERLGVADRVEWLGSRSDIPQLMKACTAVLFPTYTEGHPRSLLEAMAMARPLAATPVGGIMDMVLPGVTGLYFDVEDDAGLARCVDDLVRCPQRAERMGLCAQQYVREHFQPAQQIERAMGIFEAILRRRGR